MTKFEANRFLIFGFLLVGFHVNSSGGSKIEIAFHRCLA